MPKSTRVQFIERDRVRHINLHGVAPRQVAVDSGYASDANLVAAKALGVKDMAFNKKRTFELELRAIYPASNVRMEWGVVTGKGLNISSPTYGHRSSRIT